jgi:hypothetical protein
MDEHDWLAQRVEEHRAPPAGRGLPDARLAERGRGAVQEAWLRLSRSGADGVENLGG